MCFAAMFNLKKGNIDFGLSVQNIIDRGVRLFAQLSMM